MLLSVAVLLSGCGGPTLYKVNGRLVKQGQPFRPGEKEIVRVVFVPVKEGESATETGGYRAEFNSEDGSFKVVGENGRGMPPGKYRVCIQVVKNHKDILKGAFGPTRSPFVREITGSSDEVVIDLDKPTS
jgi:hypothetical protein